MVSAVNKKQNKKPLILKDTRKTEFKISNMHTRGSQLLTTPVGEDLWVPGTHMVYVKKFQ